MALIRCHYFKYLCVAIVVVAAMTFWYIAHLYVTTVRISNAGLLQEVTNTLDTEVATNNSYQGKCSIPFQKSLVIFTNEKSIVFTHSWILLLYVA